jgi:hypothetical protein
MKSFAVSAGVLMYVVIVIAIAMQFSKPGIHTRTVQTIAIDPDTELERDMQHGN